MRPGGEIPDRQRPQTPGIGTARRLERCAPPLAIVDLDINVGDRLTAETTEKGGMMMVRTLTVSTPKK